MTAAMWVAIAVALVVGAAGVFGAYYYGEVRGRDR